MPYVESQIEGDRLKELGFRANERAFDLPNENPVILESPDQNWTPDQVEQIIPEKGLDFNKLTIDNFEINQYIKGGATGYNSGSGWWIGRDEDGTAKMFFGNSTGNKVTWDGTTLSVSGTLTAGDIHIPDTTTANSFHVDSDGNAWWGTNVATGSATAPAKVLKDGSATFTSVTATGTINATAGYFTNGMTIGDGTTNGQITFDHTDTAGDSYIASGKSDFTNVDTGFILGIDDSDSDKAKFYIGSSTNYLNWDGSALVLNAGVFNTGSLTNALTLGDGATNSGRLTLSHADTYGDTYINAGKTDFTTTDAGFILGYDDSDSDKIKFYLGDNTNYISWDGTNLTVTGGVAVGNIDIPDTTTANSFHVDNSGNSWWGANIATGYAGAPAYVLNDGSAYFSTLTIADTGISMEDIYGDGSDGNVTISAPTTLTSDMFYDNLTVSDTLSTGGYRIFVAGTLSGSGTIQNIGGDGGNGANASTFNGGAGGSAGTSASGNSVPAGTAGEDGGTGGAGQFGNGLAGTAGTVGDNASKALNNNDGKIGAVGGNAGDGAITSGGAGGGAGAGGTVSGTILNKIRNAISAYFLSDHIGGWTNFTTSGGTGSSGGGGGGGGNNGVIAGGGGGGGAGSGANGGIVWISSRTSTFSGTFSAVGGVGGDGGDGAAGMGADAGGGGGGGAGSGGNGGVVIHIYSSISGSPTYNISGGAAGSVGSGGASGGGSADAGSDGATGTAGTDGTSITLVI